MRGSRLPFREDPEPKGSGDGGRVCSSHTKDVVPSVLAQALFDQMISVGADVRKINIACCKAAMGEGPMQLFCKELVKCQKEGVKLPDGLMVCGFNVNVTTFDSESKFMDKEGAKFANYAAIKERAELAKRSVATEAGLGAIREQRPQLYVFRP